MPCKRHGPNCNKDCIDPNIDNGMMTKVWGPAGWLFTNSIVFGYPYVINPENPDHKNKKQDYYNFFYYLGKTLPCKYCRNSYDDFFKELPIENFLNSRRELCFWWYQMHNKVNQKLGVAQCNIPTFEEFQNEYEQYRAKCKKTTELERQENKIKGCIAPATGTPKRCVIKVVSIDQGDITRRGGNNNPQAFPKADDYFIIHKVSLNIIILILLAVGLLFSIKFITPLNI